MEESDDIPGFDELGSEDVIGVCGCADRHVSRGCRPPSHTWQPWQAARSGRSGSRACTLWSLTAVVLRACSVCLPAAEGEDDEGFGPSDELGEGGGVGGMG